MISAENEKAPTIARSTTATASDVSEYGAMTGTKKKFKQSKYNYNCSKNKIEEPQSRDRESTCARDLAIEEVEVLPGFCRIEDGLFSQHLRSSKIK